MPWRRAATLTCQEGHVLWTSGNYLSPPKAIERCECRDRQSKASPVLLPLLFHLGQPFSLEGRIVHVEIRVDHDLHGRDPAEAAYGLAFGYDFEATALMSEPDLAAFKRLIGEREDFPAKLGNRDFHGNSVPRCTLISVHDVHLALTRACVQYGPAALTIPLGKRWPRLRKRFSRLFARIAGRW